MAERIEVHVPDIGDFDAVDVAEVLVQPGDVVAAEDSLLTLESDKASMDVPAPRAGKIVEIKVEEGAQVAQGTLIAIMEAAEATASEAPEAEAPAKAEAAPPKEEAAPAPKAEPAPAPVAAAPEAPKKLYGDPPPQPPGEAASGAGVHASPSVRRFARELGADLSKVPGTGRKGRITKDDVKTYIKQRLSGAEAPTSGAPQAADGALALPPMPKIDFSKFGEIEHQPLSRIRKISAQSLHRSWLHVPHVTQHDEADITEMEAFRKEMKAEAIEKGFKLTPLAFIMKAVVAGLKAYPRFNSSLDPEGESLILKKYCHLGIAVDTPNGLVVPVIRDVDQKSLYEISADLAEVSGRARQGKLRPADIQGACFSISSLGGIGGTAFTPIVNAPEVAILGVSRSSMKPVWNGKEFVPRLMLPLSLSYDHRVIDGADAARFTTFLAQTLGDIRRLLL